MAQNSDSIVYKNVLAWRGCEKLYLDSRTCDVHFIIPSENGECEKVPAHRSILSAISPVFDGIFYGELKQEGDINVTDANPEAFKEFLQFFYRSQVKLTTENLSEVMNLGRYYLLNDCINACTDFCEKTLTVDNMCWGYELAILFDMENLKKFCEDQIGEKTAEIFRSDSFLNCEPNLLRHILHLDSLKCDESVVFDGCMAWAKAACIRKGVDEKSMQNLRSQLGDLFYEIRFGELSHKDFQEKYRLYDGLFTFDEYKDVNMMIACKEYRPAMFRRSARTANDKYQPHNEVLVCESEVGSQERLPYTLTITFESSSWLLLEKLYSLLIINDGHSIRKSSATIKIFKCPETLIFHSLIPLQSVIEEMYELPEPVVIQPSTQYRIELLHRGNQNIFWCNRKFAPIIRMNEGTVIKFISQLGASPITSLDFTRYNKPV